MKYIAATIALWLIAIVSTLLIVKDTAAFSYLGPVYFICLVGSILMMRSATRSAFK
jgi:hypothetical protein